MKPILFSTPMVQAILDGQKTVTRRLVKNDDNRGIWAAVNNVREMSEYGASVPCYLHREISVDVKSPNIIYPKYDVGDILYVRETWNSDWCDHVIYKADGGSAIAAGYAKEPKWRPSIHMPREAARIFLRVTGVRVERLRDISVQDAKDEGIKVHANGCVDGLAFGCYNGDDCVYNRCRRPIDYFSDLWDAINAKRGYGWDANPWVWVIEFERCDKEEI